MFTMPFCCSKVNNPFEMVKIWALTTPTKNKISLPFPYGCWSKKAFFQNLSWHSM